MSIVGAARFASRKFRVALSPGTVGRALLAMPLSVYLVAFAFIPLGTLLLYSFWTDAFFAPPIKDFTLSNYEALFIDQRDVFLKILGRTLLLACLVTFACLLIGFPTAYYLARYVRARGVVLTLLLVPLATCYLVKIYAWRGVLGERGLINYSLQKIGFLENPLGFLLFNRFAVGLALVSVLLPFMILPIYSAIERIPKSLFEAAYDLGATGRRTFWRILLPLTQRGVIAGATFVFILTLGDFVASQLLGGISGLLIGKVIYGYFGLADNWPEGSAMAFTVLLVAALILALLAWLGRRGGGRPDAALDSRIAR